MGEVAEGRKEVGGEVLGTRAWDFDDPVGLAVPGLPLSLALTKNSSAQRGFGSGSGGTPGWR